MAKALGELSMGKQPRDHYVPQFYLSRWATNGSILAAKYIDHTETLSWDFHSPKETGYERGLYGKVETLFFKPLDDKASKIAVNLHGKKIESLRKYDLGEEKHELWAKYLLAQIIRVPKYANEIYKKYTDSGISLEEAQRELPNIIENEKAIKDIRALKWIFAKVDSSLELITSDNPLIFKPRDLSHKSCELILPMGPQNFFLATDERNIGRLETNPRKMVSYINQETVANSCKRVYARSRHSIKNEFLLKHWRKAT